MSPFSPLYPSALTPFHLLLCSAGQQQEDSSIRARKTRKAHEDIFGCNMAIYIYSMYKAF